MKKRAIQILKIVVPLGIGVYLTWYFISRMSVADQGKVADIFSNANYLIIFLSVLFSWLSHMSRSMRWKYLLEPMGYEPRVWNCYHSVMIGYLMNLLIPRAGEISRAGFLATYEKVPFEKGFGTILAERVIDVLMLGTISVITIFLQYDKFLELWSELQGMKGGSGEGNVWINYLIRGILVLGVAAIAFMWFHKSTRAKVKKLISGFWDGLTSILKLKKRWAFIGHTLFIWTMYISLYLVCFYSIPETSTIPISALMLGFLGGSIGIIIVQGGIGIYPVLVATALSFHGAEYNVVYALGWVVWLAQTLLIIVAGGISLVMMPKVNEPKGRLADNL